MPGRTSATLWLTETAQLPAPWRASKTSDPASFPDMPAEKSDTRPDTENLWLLPDSGHAASPSSTIPPETRSAPSFSSETYSKNASSQNATGPANSCGYGWASGERADQAVVSGKPVPGHLAGIHDVRQAGKYRVGEPVAAQIVPNPLDRIEFRAVGRQLQ